jgi:hypothetical protein
VRDSADDHPRFFFFQVLDGLDVVRKIEGQKVNADDKPLKACVIADCGQLS